MTRSQSVPNPAISVLFIVYNHAPFVQQALESVLSQKFVEPLEILIGDDCSTDGSSELLAEIIEGYKGEFVINYCRRPGNLGMHRNFWKTYISAHGKYVALLEGDDYWTDELKLHRQFEILERTGAVLCGHRVALHDSAGNTLGNLPSERIRTITEGADFLGDGSYLHTSSLCFRRSLPDPPPAYLLDERNRCLDNSLQQLLSDQGRVATLPEIMSVYRNPGGAASRDLWFRGVAFDKARIFMLNGFDAYTRGKHRRKVRYLKAVRYRSVAQNVGEVPAALRLLYRIWAAFLTQRMTLGRLRRALVSLFIPAQKSPDEIGASGHAPDDGDP